MLTLTAADRLDDKATGFELSICSPPWPNSLSDSPRVARNGCGSSTSATGPAGRSPPASFVSRTSIARADRLAQ
jgi:hypothetical protein